MNEVNVPPATVPFGTTWHERRSIPRFVHRRGNEYIIEVVGATHFAEQYRFLPVKSSFIQANSESLEYLLVYDYQPLVAIGSEAVVRLQMIDGVVCADNSFVANIEDGHICVPQITRERAMEIARRNFKFHPADDVSCVVERPGWMSPHLKNWTWAVLVTRETSDNSVSRATFTLFVDAVTGKYLGSRERSWLFRDAPHRRIK